MSSQKEKPQTAEDGEKPIVSTDVEDYLPQNNDLVIRDGFPALRMSSTGGPNIDCDEPLPRHKFWAADNALNLEPHWEALLADCETVFTARTREDDQAYSAGTTYFMPCQMKPRCALEALVLSIFQKHTAALDSTTYIPEQSGAEWWTLVMDDEGEKAPDNNDDDDEGDEVGLHFDADYGLEAQAPNLLLHPRLASVTYLTDFGSPTVVLDLQSPPPGDTEKKTLQKNIPTAWLSRPKIGKHMVFDGRLLHGAPSTFFPGMVTTTAAVSSSSDTDLPLRKKAKLLRPPPHKKRITLLVNIWLNHCPLDAEPLDDEVIEELKTPWESSDSGKTDDSFVPPFSWNNDIDLDKPVECSRVTLTASPSDPAGTEEVVICGRLVTVHYGASMSDFHKAARTADGLVQLDLDRDVIALTVGDEVEDESDEDDNLEKEEEE
jgi:hypothetical protein